MVAGWTNGDNKNEDEEMILLGELLHVMPCSRPGWYAFFEDPDDEECPIWAEAIEAWGTFSVPITYNGEMDTQVRAMKVDEGSGTLDSSFLDAENFLGVFFSRTLSETARSHMIEYHEFTTDSSLLTRLDTLVRERHTPTEAEADAESHLPVEEE